MRVLYVEDDKTLARTVEHMLNREGYKCHWATTGEDAVTLGKSVDYDVILLDIGLPDMDGYEVVRQLRDAAVDKPFLIQSGLVPEDKDGDGLGFGVEDYLVKPFNRRDLFLKLEKAMVRHARQRTIADDRRQDKRVEDWDAGQIVFDDGEAAACTVFSRSSGGAALKVSNSERCLTQAFTLRIGDGDGRRCQTCWQFGNKIGVKFV